MTVWHEALQWVAEQAGQVEQAPSTNPNHDIAVALIGTGGSIALAFVGLLTTLRRKEPATLPPTTPPVAPLSSDDEQELTECRALARRYETFLWRNHCDPNKILTGSESMADVHFE